jgi:hypothetical protein
MLHFVLFNGFKLSFKSVYQYLFLLEFSINMMKSEDNFLEKVSFSPLKSTKCNMPLKIFVTWQIFLGLPGHRESKLYFATAIAAL